MNQSRTIKKKLDSTCWSPTVQTYQNSPIKNCTSSYSSAAQHEEISLRDEQLQLDSLWNKALSPQKTSPHNGQLQRTRKSSSYHQENRSTENCADHFGHVSQKTPTKSGAWLRKPSVKSSRKEDIEVNN